MKNLIHQILKEEKESFYKKVADILQPPYFENLQKMSITDDYEIKKILEHKFDHPVNIRYSPPKTHEDMSIGWVEYGGDNANLYDESNFGHIFGKSLYSEEGDYWSVREYNDDGELTNEWDIGGGW